MAYTINRWNKSVLTVVEDGTIDQTTDIKLVGKNFAGYGEIQNENFVFLLENFAGANPPPKAISGQLWFDSSTSKLRFYDGNRFRNTGGSEIGEERPSGLTVGDFWWDTANDQLYAFNGQDFVLVGPQDAGEGITQMQSMTVTDTNGFLHSVIVSTINDDAVHVISDDEFELEPSSKPSELDNFDIIKKGLTLTNTTKSTGGVSQDGYVYWGTASNARKLGGIDASEFVQKGSPVFNSAEFGDDGISIGDSNDLRLMIINDNQGVMQNEIGNVIIFRVKNDQGSIVESTRMDSDGLSPGLDSAGNFPRDVTIGKQNVPFANVFADKFTGLAEKAESLEFQDEKKFPDIQETANSVAIRDASGDLRANLFRGTALAAKYADIAEIYTTDENYETGTIVSVNSGPGAEITSCGKDSVPVGVVSENPSFIMNSESDGQQIAIKGRVPIKVFGRVSKGEPIKVLDNGVGISKSNASKENLEIVGIALEESNVETVDYVECILKV